MDNTIWGFIVRSSTCTAIEDSLTGICIAGFVDVNGSKSPNMFGKDLFFFWIVKKNGTYVVYPGGSNGDTDSCEDNSNSMITSKGCSKEALLASSPDDMP